MKKIRIGNDIVIKWRVTINGEEVNLDGLDLSLYISTTYQPRKAIAFTVAGNEITATYKGTAQKVTGVYRLTLYRNEGENSQNILDACDAFELVSCSCLTVDTAFGGAEVELPVADLGVGIPGLSAYEIAVAEGFEGTQEEWLASLSAASEAAAAECREFTEAAKIDEKERQDNEALRLTAEDEREAAETARQEAEQGRVTAEQQRADAEAARAEEFATFESKIAAKEDAANKVTSLDNPSDVTFPTTKAVWSAICPSFSANDAANSAIREIYIKSSVANEFKIALFRLNSSQYFNLIIHKNGNVLCQYVVNSGLDFYNPIKVPVIDYSNDEVYILVNPEAQGVNISQVVLDSRVVTNINNSPRIVDWLIKRENDNIKEWCARNSNNMHIKELYLPNLESWAGIGAKIKRLYVSKTHLRLFINNSAGELVLNCGYDVDEEVYASNAVFRLINTSNETVGYFIPNYDGSNYYLDELYDINYKVVGDLNNCPKIKEILNSGKQLVLVGDSILGQPATNLIGAMIRGKLGINVINIACGGCTMALRNTDYYDAFSFTKIMDSLAAGNNDIQSQAIANKPSSAVDMSIQSNKLRDINLSINTVIISDYINNDLTNNVPVGSLWDGNQELENYDKTKFCDAQAYGLQVLMNTHPDVRIAFISDSWRYRGGLPPHKYVNGNGVSAYEYSEAFKNNCKRLGAKFVEFSNYGIRNAFNMSNTTLDGTHNNYKGFIELSKYLINIYKSFEV